LAAENTRDPKSDNGTSGGTARRSTHMNATAATTATSPAAYEIGPAAGEVSAKVSPARATTVRNAPTMSKRPVRGRAALRRHPDDEREHDQAERHVDPEDPPPRGMVDQPSTHEGTESRSGPGHAGPRPDRGRAIAGRETRLDDRERAGGEQGGADALEHARPDELTRRLCDGAEQRSDEEPCDPDDVDSPASQPI
jgi:hypothetical protein